MNVPFCSYTCGTKVRGVRVIWTWVAMIILLWLLGFGFEVGGVWIHGLLGIVVLLVVFQVFRYIKR